MKTLYYVTDHGLGHSTRTVAIIRELQKYSDVIIRGNDSFQLLRKSLPDTKIILGPADFYPVMDLKNSMKFDKQKTSEAILSWIKKMPVLVQNESKLVQKIKPDLIVSDVSFMPIIVSKENNIRSIVVSNFVWNEVLDLSKEIKSFIHDSYADATKIIKLPFGTKVEFKTTASLGLAARKITVKKDEIRKNLRVNKKQKLVLLSIGNLTSKICYSDNQDMKIIDLSDYEKIRKLKHLNLTEGQNLINAADLVICKCGYGFISECLTFGTNFNYLLETRHKEALGIHRNLVGYGINNEIKIGQIQKILNGKFFPENHALKLPNKTNQIARDILTI